MSWLVDDWRQALKWSSVRLHAAVLVLVAIYEIAPTLDPSIAAMFPAHIRPSVIGIYAILGLLLRVTKLKANG